MNSLDFAYRLLDDAVENDYTKLVEKLIFDLNTYDALLGLVLTQWSSIEEFEKARKKLLEERIR